MGGYRSYNGLSEPSIADIKPNLFTINAKIIWAHELVKYIYDNWSELYLE